MENIQKRQIYRVESRSVVGCGWVYEQGLSANRYEGTFGADASVIKMIIIMVPHTA